MLAVADVEVEEAVEHAPILWIVLILVSCPSEPAEWWPDTTTPEPLSIALEHQYQLHLREWTTRIVPTSPEWENFGKTDDEVFDAAFKLAGDPSNRQH